MRCFKLFAFDISCSIFCSPQRWPGISLCPQALTCTCAQHVLHMRLQRNEQREVGDRLPPHPVLQQGEAGDALWFTRETPQAYTRRMEKGIGSQRYLSKLSEGCCHRGTPHSPAGPSPTSPLWNQQRELAGLKEVFSCAIFSPWSRSAAEVPVLLYGDLGQGFGRSNTFLLQTWCQVWLPRTLHVSGKVAVFGGSFTDCI